MLRIFLMIFCFVLMGGMMWYTEDSKPTMPGNAIVEGVVVNQKNGKPISRAMVGLCYHDTRMFKEGLWVGGEDCQQPSWLGYTDGTGNFKIPAKVDTTGLPTFVWLRISHPAFESMHEVFIQIKPGNNVFGVLPLRQQEPYTESSRSKLIPSRYVQPKTVFTEICQQLEKQFDQEALSQLPSVHEVFPQGGFVKCYNVQRGYNAKPKDFNRNSWDAYNTLLIPTDLAVAAMVEGEVGTFTYHPEALKSQAVWARTYALYKGMHHQAPQNLQLAFKTNISASSLRASQETSGKILTHRSAKYGQGNPILSVFSARCNGDFTQAGTEAKWKPCQLGGTYSPYLLKVACSGHGNCKTGGMKASVCCEIDPERGRYLYGHGAGGCQYGMKDFAEKIDWDYEKISTHYFKGSYLVDFHQNVWNQLGS